jgi:hypothetical protein
MLMETKTKKEGVIELPGAYYGPAGYAGCAERQRVASLLEGDGATPGFSGFPPEHLPARDIEGIDKLTGRRIRQAPEGKENVNNSRVSALLARKRLNRLQFDAAMTYYQDWHDSQIESAPSPALIRVDGGMKFATLSDFKLDAQERHKRARKWLERMFYGRCLAIVEKVVLDEKIVEEAAAECKMHHQRAATLLEFGCDILAEFAYNRS